MKNAFKLCMGNNVFWQSLFTVYAYGNISGWTQVPTGYNKNSHRDFCNALLFVNIFFHVDPGLLNSKGVRTQGEASDLSYT